MAYMTSIHSIYSHITRLYSTSDIVTNKTCSFTVHVSTTHGYNMYIYVLQRVCVHQLPILPSLLRHACTYLELQYKLGCISCTQNLSQLIGQERRVWS